MAIEIDGKFPFVHLKKKQKAQAYDMSQMTNQSVVGIIEQMCLDLRPEDEILETLNEMGLDEKSAKKIYFLARSNILKEFKTDMDRLTVQNLEARLPEIIRKMQKDTKHRAEMREIMENFDKIGLEELRVGDLKKKPKSAETAGENGD
ncbi:MAG: hypothetical protein ABID38_02750 [Candidatus Diapherotrites archaeon]